MRKEEKEERRGEEERRGGGGAERTKSYNLHTDGGEKLLLANVKIPNTLSLVLLNTIQHSFR